MTKHNRNDFYNRKNTENEYANTFTEEVIHNEIFVVKGSGENMTEGH